MRLPPYRGCVAPQRPVSINTDSPQCRDLESCWLGNTVAWGDIPVPGGLAARTVGGTVIPGSHVGLVSTAQVVMLPRTRLVSSPTTMVVWVQWTAQTALIDVRNAAATAYHQIYLRGSGAAFRPTTNGNYTAISGTTLGAPIHLAMVCDGLSYRCGYYNGVAGAANTVTVADGTLDRLSVGASAVSTDAIIEWRLYNRALTAAEIWSLYAPETRWDLYAPA